MSEELVGSSTPQSPPTYTTCQMSLSQRESPPASPSTDKQSSSGSLRLRASGAQLDAEQRRVAQLSNRGSSSTVQNISNFPHIDLPTPQKTDATTIPVLTQMNATSSPQNIHTHTGSTGTPRKIDSPPVAQKAITISSRTGSVVSKTKLQSNTTSASSNPSTTQLNGYPHTLSGSGGARRSPHSSPKPSAKAKKNVENLVAKKPSETQRANVNEIPEAFLPSIDFSQVDHPIENPKSYIEERLQPGTFIIWKDSDEQCYLSSKSLDGGEPLHENGAEKSTINSYKTFVGSTHFVNLRDPGLIKKKETSTVENFLKQQQGNKWALSTAPHTDGNDPNRFDLILSVKDGSKVKSYRLSNNPTEFHTQYVTCLGSENSSQLTSLTPSVATATRTGHSPSNGHGSGTTQNTTPSSGLGLSINTSGPDLREAFNAHTPPTG